MREDLNDMGVKIPARLNSVVDESLREVTKLHRRKMGRRAGTVCGSFFALVGAFLIFGFTNPAMASEIPLLGNLFKNVSQKTGSISTNLQGYNVQAVGKLAATDSKDWNLLATEAYSDGNVVQVGLELSAPEETMGRFTYLSVKREGREYPCDAAINGEKAEIDTVSLFTREGEKLIGAIKLKVPESQRDAETLSVSFTLRELEGELAEKGENSGAYEDIPGEFKLEFPVAVDRENRVEFTSGAEDNGAKVLAVKSTPAQTVITVEKPYWGDVSPAAEDGSLGVPVLSTADGAEIEPNRTDTAELGGYDFRSRETQTADLYFDGVPAGTKVVTLKFIASRDGRHDVYAQFTIDLEKQTVTPAGTPATEVVTYERNSIIGKGLGEEQNGLTVGAVEIICSNGVWQAGLSVSWEPGTGTNSQRLRVELYNADGELLAASDSHMADGERNPQWGMGWSGEEVLSSYLPLLTLNADGEGGRLPQAGEEVTVLVKDLDSGEVLLTETRVLN